MTQELTSTPDPASVAPPTPSTAPWGPIPEEIVEDWRWIFQGREEGLFEAYRGRHIAVVGQKILGSGSDPFQLWQTLTEKHGLDPGRLVIAFIDRE